METSKWLFYILLECNVNVNNQHVAQKALILLQFRIEHFLLKIFWYFQKLYVLFCFIYLELKDIIRLRWTQRKNKWKNYEIFCRKARIQNFTDINTFWVICQLNFKIDLRWVRWVKYRLDNGCMEFELLNLIFVRITAFFKNMCIYSFWTFLWKSSPYPERVILKVYFYFRGFCEGNISFSFPLCRKLLFSYFYFILSMFWNFTLFTPFIVASY